jgi:hypothetical protein
MITPIVGLPLSPAVIFSMRWLESRGRSGLFRRHLGDATNLSLKNALALGPPACKSARFSRPKARQAPITPRRGEVNRQLRDLRRVSLSLASFVFSRFNISLLRFVTATVNLSFWV